MDINTPAFGDINVKNKGKNYLALEGQMIDSVSHVCQSAYFIGLL